MNKTQHFFVALLLLLMITPCLTWAQKKELNQARSLIKTGKDKELAQAEKLMKDLLKTQENRENKKIYQTWYDAVRGQYTLANERMYLKQKQDTAAFFDLNRRMFTVLEALDSVEMRPDKKGRVNIEYRDKHAKVLDPYRANLFNAGTYFLRKNEWKEAFEFFEFYLNTADQPLFEKQNYMAADLRMPETAYWATYCGYRLQDPVLTLRHHELALNDSTKMSFTYQYIAEARRWLNDQELYLETLEKGFRHDPTFSYFFPRLIDAYSARGNNERALALTDSVLSVCDSCELYLFAKSTLLFRLQRYGECVKVSDQVIAINPNHAEAYFNAGTAFVNIALKLDERKDKKQLRKIFQKARPYLERYRKMMPDEVKKWGPPLYRIYLNLNMGRQFDEIDRLLNSKN